MKLFDNPAFDGIDKAFLTKTENMINNLSGKNSTEVMACMMAISNEAKKYNVNITPERQKAILEVLRNNLPVEKRKQFDSFINLFSHMS